ncbi:Uncharacterised protein [Chlamydia trachomatis]|nr:Uncharacterised protein [Chlamydia trachomatis]
MIPVGMLVPPRVCIVAFFSLAFSFWLVNTLWLLFFCAFTIAEFLFSLITRCES